MSINKTLIFHIGSKNPRYVCSINDINFAPACSNQRFWYACYF